MFMSFEMEQTGVWRIVIFGSTASDNLKRFATISTLKRKAMIHYVYDIFQFGFDDGEE